jgi:hypothetical protein
MKTYYKIVELGDDGIYTLFHGINGTRLLPVGKWIKGERKENVQDGHGTRYTSGIHVVDGLEECKKYLKRFKRTDRIIVPCYVKGIRKKEHSPSKVYLVDKIKILG